MKKRRILKQALTEIGIASYAFDVTAEEYQSALAVMDGMAAELFPTHQTGYIFPADGVESDPDDEAGITESAFPMFYTNLALRLAPGYGKTVSAWTVKAAKDSLDRYQLNNLTIPERCLPGTMPVGQGAGRSVRDNPFIWACGCGSICADGSSCLSRIACYNPLDGLAPVVNELDMNLQYQLPQEL